MTGTRVRQVVIERPFQVSVTECELPPPGPGQTLVQTRQVGICGSDLHALAGEHPFVPLPCRPGHEVVGVVRAVGADVVGLGPGDRVIVEPSLVCGHCRYCASGRYNLCEELIVFGCQSAGAMADAFTIDASRAIPVQGELSDTAAALVEPLATCTHAIRMAGGVGGKSVAVLGAGSIGLLMLLASRFDGATVAMTDVVASKRERALRLGAIAAIDPLEPNAVERVRTTLGGRPDVTFDCVATQASTDLALALAMKSGTVMVVGVPTGPVSIALPLLQDREVTIRGSLMYVRADIDRAFHLLRSRAIPDREIVTATFPLERAAEAFEAARGGEEVKVQLIVGTAAA